MNIKKSNFFKFYRVFKNDTLVTEVSVNDFKPAKKWKVKNGADLDNVILKPVYFLPKDGKMFYGYASKGHAMEMAKAGALKYIGMLISQAEKGISQLKQYRIDHYDDLNINLLDANIRLTKNE
ncbi:MAG: hypothetical protein H7Y07_17070 [Pyrinomonadaceae bacterium]|nr:hypothetical protein [Sphingobacteriaceae bacterium]